MSNMKVRYSYLRQQFSNSDDLWLKLKRFVSTGDFTLGKPLLEFERKFAKLMGVKYAVGVNSGTDAIKLSLKVLGIKAGDEIITAANTFVATVGAITELGAKPVFVDCDDTFCMDVNLIEKKITKKTKAIVPVHFTGYMTNMPALMALSKKYKIPIIEDACQSILANINKKNAGTWGIAGSFSLHPLKNINVWSDGGVITTNNYSMYKKILLLRNKSGLSIDLSTCVSAARFIKPFGLNRSKTSNIFGVFTISKFIKKYFLLFVIFFNESKFEEYVSLSIFTTSTLGIVKRYLIKFDPIKPQPPVIIIFIL